MGRKKLRKNRYKKMNNGLFKPGFQVLLMISSVVVLLFIISGVYIYCYGYIMQPSFFNAANLTVSGSQRLTEKEILKQAGIRPMQNILTVNLSVARNRLLAHPWINGAEVGRVVPNGIYIKITEHKPIAIIHLDRKFLIAENGIIFKEKSTSDPENLPVVSGLKYSDIKIYPVSNRSYKNNRTQFHASGDQIVNNPFDAVMDVLMLGRSPGCTVPNSSIKEIRVDRKLGLTLYAYKEVKIIKLGYNKYSEKYTLLKKVMSYLKHKKNSDFHNFISIDLNNLNRIVVNPVRKGTS